MIKPTENFVLVKETQLDQTGKTGLVFAAETQFSVVRDGQNALEAGQIVFLSKAPVIIKHNGEKYGLATQDTIAGFIE